MYKREKGRGKLKLKGVKKLVRIGANRKRRLGALQHWMAIFSPKKARPLVT